MPPPSLQRAWRMKRWMRRLSGLTLNPLTQSRGVDAWISSLQDIRASHSPLPEPNVRKKTRATSGRSYGKSSAPSNPGSVSSKTSHIIYDWGLNKSMMTYDQWVSALRRVEERHKTWMLQNGYWEAQAECDGRTAGFHLSSLYSPYGWRSWAQIARAWVDAQGSDAAIKSFKNTELGETYVETGEAPDWQRLYERREPYKIGSIPKAGLFITAGADVQKDRIEVSIWAWGRDKESWLIDHRILEGDTGRAAVWNKLTEFLGERWPHENGFDLALKRVAVDSGYATQEVYDWARRQSPSLVMVVIQ